MPTRAVVLALVLATPWWVALGVVHAASPAHGRPPGTAGEPAHAFVRALPPSLRHEATEVVARAIARFDAASPPPTPDRSDGTPSFDLDLSHGWRVAWDGRTGVDLALTARTLLVDPSAPNERARRRATSDRRALESELQIQRALDDWLEHRLALWQAQRRLDLLRVARQLPVPNGADAAARYAALLAMEPDLRSDRNRIAFGLAHHAGVDPRRPPDPGDRAWDAWAVRRDDRDARGCVEGRADLRLARLSLREARERLAARSPWTPAVTLGAAADLSVAHVGAEPPHVGGRIWLEIGMPSAWPVHGSARTELDAHGASLRLRAAGSTDPDLPSPNPSRDLSEVANAEATLADARFRADDWARATNHDLRTTSRRHEARTAVGEADAVRTVGDLEAAWERLGRTVRLASLRIDLDRTCHVADQIR